jgi:hypothetical protein
MLKRIVVIQFVALLSLALAGTSIAETTQHTHPTTGTQQTTTGGGQNDPAQMFQQILQQLTQGQARPTPKPGTGPNGAGSTGGIKSAGAVAGTQMKPTSTKSGSSHTKGKR